MPGINHPNGKRTGSYIARCYLSTQRALYNFLIHNTAFYLTFIQIHTPMDASQRILELVSCPRVFGIQAGADGDQTTNLSIIR